MVIFILCAFYWQCSSQEMERSADVLAAGLLEMADPSLSNKFFLRQVSLYSLILFTCLNKL